MNYLIRSTLCENKNKKKNSRLDTPCFVYIFFFLLLLFLSMSISFLIKKQLSRSQQQFIFHTTKRKNFILAPIIALNLNNHCRHDMATAAALSKTRMTKLCKNNTMWTLQVRNIHHASTLRNQPHVTKAELLSQARGFLERLKIRIKYPLMRQIRPWTLNDATALFSWLFLGHTVWLLVGTTSFVSLILWTANSLQFQGKSPPSL